MKVKACGIEVDAALLLVELYKRAPRASSAWGYKEQLLIGEAHTLIAAKKLTREAQGQDPNMCFEFTGTLYGRRLNVHAERGGVVYGMQYNAHAGPGKFEEAVQAAKARESE